MPRDTTFVVLASGRGRRMGGVDKALLDLGGRPVLAWSLAAARAVADVAEVVVVASAETEAGLAARWNASAAELGADRVVRGGAERWLSSRAGVEAARTEFVVVHDAARPLLAAADLAAVLAAVRDADAALLAEPVADTLKEDDGGGRVARTVDRSRLWRALTPQGARTAALRDAFTRWPADAPPPTDEARVLEAVGLRPRLVAATAPNPKLTRPADLPLLEALLAAREAAAPSPDTP